MTYLQLLQALHRESGIAGAAPGDVTGLSGIAAKMADWLATAWVDIQTSRKWSFLLTEADVALTVGQRDYDVVTDLSLPYVREFDTSFAGLLQPDDTPIGPVRWMPYAEFRGRYGMATPESGQPSSMALVAGSTLRLNTLPDEAYKLRLAYWQTAEKLVASTDTPSLNEEEQKIIVWRALMYYAAHEGAAEIYGDAQAKYQTLFSVLCQRYLPNITFGAPLV